MQNIKERRSPRPPFSAIRRAGARRSLISAELHGGHPLATSCVARLPVERRSNPPPNTTTKLVASGGATAPAEQLRREAGRMGGDSNPWYLAVHTLSRRAQSTALSPILPSTSVAAVYDCRTYRRTNNATVADRRYQKNHNCSRRNNSSSGSWMPIKNSPKSP
jgi:hypothetical protein